MKNKSSKKFILLIVTLSIYLFAWCLFQPKIFTHAQFGCSGPPTWGTPPTTNAFPLGTTVSVLIFDTPDETDFRIIDTAIRKWNALRTPDCYNITFLPAVPADFVFEPGMEPPNNTLWVVRYNVANAPPANQYNFYRNRGTPQQNVRSAITRIDTRYNHTNTGNQGIYLNYMAAHEPGHSLGLWNEDPSTTDSVMGSNFNGPTNCDREALMQVYCPTPSPTPTPSPNPTPTPSYCSFPVNYALYPATGCPAGRVNQAGCCTCSRSQIFIQQCLQNNGDYDPDLCGCTGSCGADGSCSPIVVDILGNGFSLTNVPNGVTFDLEGTGNQRRCGWTAIDSDEAWLALDRNQNGLIDNGKELFGNVTAQEPQIGIERNGFLALAEYDKPMNGGNLDGKINQQDFIFHRLHLWQDANHDGISQINELKTLTELGLRKLELDYRESRRVDQHGNQFKYRAKVRDAQDAQMGRWAWDVFLVTEP